MIDIIGDIHGYADKLELILQQLGYENSKGFYQHPDKNRSILFIGDYIDRGPKIRETLELVKAMVDNDSAIALMGDHEYNAILFNTKDFDGNYLREHNQQNINQHSATLEAFNNKEDEYKKYIEWFKSLPLFYENEHFRAVHAAWNYNSIQCLKAVLDNAHITDELILEAADESTDLFDAIEITLKGKEIEFPAGNIFKDKDGHERSSIRTKWWENPIKNTFKSIAIHPNGTYPDDKIELADSFYDANDKPVFFGHYWLKGEPKLFQNNICCVDYSVANNGKLVCYTYNNEKKLNDSNFTFV